MSELPQNKLEQKTISRLTELGRRKDVRKMLHQFLLDITEKTAALADDLDEVICVYASENCSELALPANALKEAYRKIQELLADVRLNENKVLHRDQLNSILNECPEALG